MNRTSCVWVLAGLAAVGCAVAVRGAEAQDARAAAASVSADLRRDVEVMRRVLLREGLGAGAPGTVAFPSAGRTEYLGPWIAGGRAGAGEAFVVPGDGVTFLLRTSDPVAPQPAAAGAADAPNEPSAWDEAEAEVEGRTQRVRVRTTASPDRYDAQKVDALRARVLEQLARWGHRLRGLEPTDHLTVLVAGGGGQGVAAAAYLLDAAAASQQSGAENVTLRLVTDKTAVTTVLTIRVSLADCHAFAREEIDLDTFRRRAVTAAY